MTGSPKFKSIPNYIKKPHVAKLVAPKRPSKPPTKQYKSLKQLFKKALTPRLVAPKRPSKPPTRLPTPKLTAPKRPSKPPTRQPTPKLTAPKRPSKPPTRQPTPKLTRRVASPKRVVGPPKKIASPVKKVVGPPKKIASPKRVVGPPKIASPVKKVVAKPKIASPVKKIVGPPKKIASPVKKGALPEKSEWPSLDLDDIKLLQKYTIMNPRDVWGKKISNMTDAAYVEQHAPKFKTTLDILQKNILPSSRKPLVGKALIFIRNKKDGLEALTTYLTSVGKLKPIRGIDKTAHVQPGNNLLIMGEFDAKSPFYSYGAASVKASKGIVAKFNETENARGDKYPVMIVHEKYMEGLDLTGVTHIILVQDPATPGMFDQIIGRGVRNCSHINYPSTLWKVNVISLVNTYEKSTPDQVLEHNRERVTYLVDKILKTTQENSLDCTVSQKRYKHACK
jgi:hypothetical protein